MHFGLTFNGVPTNTTVDVGEVCPPASIQGQLQALAAFKSLPTGGKTHWDVKEAARAIKLKGNDS